MHEVVFPTRSGRNANERSPVADAEGPRSERMLSEAGSAVAPGSPPDEGSNPLPARAQRERHRFVVPWEI